MEIEFARTTYQISFRKQHSLALQARKMETSRHISRGLASITDLPKLARNTEERVRESQCNCDSEGLLWSSCGYQ
ncbi:hypothetical protein AOLI_G00226570 [Acnodon oligacanthus]